MAKKNNTAEKTILDAEKITKALKEGTEKQLQSILNEALSNIIKEDEDIEEVEDEVVADDGYEVEDVETEETSIDDETPEVEGDEAEVEDTEDAEDEWSDFEEYKVGDNDYDFTGVDGETALKVYNKLNDDDEIFVTKDEDGNYEFKDEETGAEYVIELDADGNDEEAEVEDDLDLDVEGDEEEEGFEIELDDEEDEDDSFGDDEEEEGFEIELDDEEDEDDDELLSEENLGYTDSYQKDVFAKKPNMSVPGKNNEDWSEGVPTGAEKPWAGKGDMKPFGEKKQELDENGNGLNAKHAMKKTQNRLNKDAQGQHVASEEGEYKGTLSEDKARKIINAAKAIQAENKLYKESIEKIKKSLYEAAVLNVNLGKIVSLLVNETTTKEEKQNILERFNNVKTLKEGNALYESIKKELNGSTKKTPIMERQISMSPSLNETTFYTQSNPSLNLMERMNNLETYYKK
jgi:segregation and condensation protein B